MNLLISTQNGFFRAKQADGAWQITAQGANGRALTCIAAGGGVILAGAKDGLLRSDDGGASWQEAGVGLTQPHVRWLAFHPQHAARAFAGTEPAALFVSDDGGASWRERAEVAEWRARFGWWLPYSPEAGCVRGFAFHGERAYAAVEVGAALRSDDGGETWRLAGGSDGRPRFGRPDSGALHPDVHSVAVHPQSADLVFAPTGGGLYRSTDGGDTWRHLYGRYTRAVWANPDDSQQLIVGAADGASGHNGHIAATHDGGASWQTISETWSGDMVERFVQMDEQLLAVMANGKLLAAPLADLAWQPILTDLPHVTAAVAA